MAADLTTKEALAVSLSLLVEDLEPHHGQMISDASSLIRGETRRRLTVHAGASPEDRPVEERMFRVRPGGFVYADELLSLDDLVSVHDANGAEVSVEVQLDDYSLPKGAHIGIKSREYALAGAPPDHRDNFLRNLPERPASGLSSDPVTQDDRPQVVKLTGRFGYTRQADGEGGYVSTVPEEIEYLTRRAVVIWDRGENQQFVEFAETPAGGFVTPDRLPMAVLNALSGWVAPREVMI